MVIFGAGASYDSCPTYPPGTDVPGSGDLARLNEYYRPPLAKDLFANRPLFVDGLDGFPQCKPIVPRLRAPAVLAGESSIETLLQEVEDEAITYSRGSQELAAVRCYLQRAISECQRDWRGTTRGVTNYLALIREIERAHVIDEPVCLVTFNYDTLLEDALVQFGFRVGRMEDYTRGVSLFRLFKLHGSVDWAREAEIQLPANMDHGHPPSVLRYQVDCADKLRLSESFVLCDPLRMGLFNHRPVFPAIAVPVERKQTFECPAYMIEDLVALMPQVTKMLVIGWRATEAHFLALLRQHVKPGVYLCIVAGDIKQAEAISVRIHRAMLNNRPSSSPEPTGFTEFIRTRRAERILAF
jgi:hypothetical protein